MTASGGETGETRVCACVCVRYRRYTTRRRRTDAHAQTLDFDAFFVSFRGFFFMRLDEGYFQRS